MIKTKTQGLVFSLIMSYAMAIGMEVYNIAIKMNFHSAAGGLSGITYTVLLDALIEASYMGLLYFCSPACGATGWARPSHSATATQAATTPTSAVCSARAVP